MDSLQRRRLNAFGRMLAFVTADPLPKPLRAAPPGFAGQIQALRSAIEQARAHVMEQQSGTTGRHVAYRRRLRAVLRTQHLQPIREIAKTLDAKTVGLPKLVNLPDRFASEESIIAAAQATQRDVTPFATLFIAKGLAPNFLTLLGQAIDTLKHAVDEYNNLRVKRMQGRKSLRATIKAGGDAQRCLTAIIRQCCAIDAEEGAAVLANWLNTSRTWKDDPKDLDPFAPENLPLVGRSGGSGTLPAATATLLASSSEAQ